MARFSVTKSLEDYRIMLEWVAMAAKWSLDRKQSWKGNGTAACEKSLKLADQTLDKAREKNLRRHTQSMAQMLVGFDDPNVTERTCAALEEAIEATNRSSSKIKGLRKKLKFIPSSSESGSVNGQTSPDKPASGKVEPFQTQRIEQAMIDHPLDQQKWLSTESVGPR
jgi:hypothetical protein